MPFYPNSNYIVPMATIRRDRRLPPDVTPIEVVVTEGVRVDPTTLVLRGARAGAYRIVPLLAPLGVKRADEILPEWVHIVEGDIVREDQVMIQRGTGRRAKKVLAPADSIVTRIEPDQLILRANPEEVEIRAIYSGTVTAVRGKREVQIEAVGALIQCAWGNGRSVFGIYKKEPDGGLQSLAQEELLTTFRGQVLLTVNPITSQVLQLARKQEVAGIIGPSMSSDLRSAALEISIPVILTEGFGAQKMSEIVYNLLRDNMGRQAAVDAVEPMRFSSELPEIFIPLPSGGSLPPMPERNQALVAGAMVRITRAPRAGIAGRVKRVIETPQVLDNGLRVAGAEVQLANGQTAFVPLGNLEMLGRALDGRR
jgi:hypothetical protein